MTYQVTILFNSRAKGSNQSWTGKVEAEGPVEALEQGTAHAVRDGNYSGIYVKATMLYEVEK